MDLAPIAGERQHLVGQLVQDLEAASVQLAGALNSSAQQQQQKPNQPDTSTTMGQESFVKVTDNVYVTIKSFALQPDQAGYINRSFEASFPSETSLLGTRWMNNQQSFTMHLQASGAPNPSSSPSSSGFQNGAGTDTTNPQVVAVKYSPMATPLADLVGGGQMGLPDSQGFGQSSASSGKFLVARHTAFKPLDNDGLQFFRPSFNQEETVEPAAAAAANWPLSCCFAMSLQRS